MTALPDEVRAVFFDAVGTLIHPHPSAAGAYHQIGQRFGSRLDAGEVSRRFALSFRQEESFDSSQAHRTDENREIQRWRRIVARVLDDVSDPEGCFHSLYDHFAHPASWQCEPGAGELLTTLRDRGYIVGIASNFDHRLRGVIAGLSELGTLDHLAISSELGWKKPAPEFFAALCSRTGLKANQILLVGDDFENDFQGAIRSGLHAQLVRSATQQSPEGLIPVLVDLFRD